MSAYDVVVVGGGHAGCEAAAAAARMGARVALVTFSRNDIGVMSCNPAIGGLGKGHIVREIDALDGLMARAADRAAIHYRMLNRSKGKAVQGPRIQADRVRYSAAVQALVEQSGVAVLEGEAVSLDIRTGKVIGLTLVDGNTVTCKAVVLATGTFLNGRMFSGLVRRHGGRSDACASVRMAEQLHDLDLPMGRLKTGTPPRLDGRTIDWQRLQRQESDAEPWTMSALSGARTLPQLTCAVTRTNVRTHDLIRDGLTRSPLRSAEMSGTGPRYCPSIEDKIARFGDREGHQVFLEPEGLDTPCVYPNGISTSLGHEDQLAFVRSIDGLERAEIMRFGYAVEYDHVDPRTLNARLGVRALPGLFLAGQVNGTTGYEEAAGQGLVAGLNAAASALGRDAVPFDRTTSYLGVMVDDLTVQGVTEPYRMLTARAEFRLRLRADNAHARLRDTGIAAGCLSEERRAYHERRRDMAVSVRQTLSASVTPGDFGQEGDCVRRSMYEWMRYPDIADAVSARVKEKHCNEAADEVLEDARYAPYLQRQAREFDRIHQDRDVKIGLDIDFARIAGLSNEMVHRFEQCRPGNLDEASRIRGVTPAALSALLIAIRRHAA